MNIADDHKPFSHRVPPLLHLDCPVAATAAADRTDVRLRAGVAAHEPMISWFCGQFDGQSRRTLAGDQTADRAGKLPGRSPFWVIAVKPASRLRGPPPPVGRVGSTNPEGTGWTVRRGSPRLAGQHVPGRLGCADLHHELQRCTVTA